MGVIRAPLKNALDGAVKVIDKVWWHWFIDVDRIMDQNNTHASSDGTDHANVVLNDTHRASDGKDHSDVVLNNAHRVSDGKNHSDVVLNNTHRVSDGTDHSDVVLNNAHRAGDGSDHSDVAANTAHAVGDGSDHSDVALNSAHRVSTSNPHSVTPAQVGNATAQWNADKLSGVTIGKQDITLGASDTTFAVTSTLVNITGEGGGNTIATITGGVVGAVYAFLFNDGLITINDDNTHSADSVDLSGAFTSADDTILNLIYDGTSWYEVSRSVN